MTQPRFQVAVVLQRGAKLIVGSEQAGEGRLHEAPAMEQDLRALSGGTHETAEGLIDLLQARQAIHAAKRELFARREQRLKARALDGVDIGQGRTDHHRMADASAEQIDAFGEAAADDEEERISERERLLNVA